MIQVGLKDFVYTSFFAVTVLYGSCDLLTEMFRTIFPFGLILTLLLICGGYFLHIPPPSREAVEAVLGKDPFSITNNENGYVMKTVAHRGAGLDAPENSLEAFRMCAEKGCDVIEFDVTLTKDEVPIIFHDTTLERMTDLKEDVSDQMWSELLGVDISVKHIYRDRFTQTNIPTLDQTVTQLLNSGQRMFIDIKDNNRKMVKVINDVFGRFPDLYSRAVVSSFYPNIIWLIRRKDPKIVCSVAWRPNAFAYTSYSYPTGKGERKYKDWFTHTLMEIVDFFYEWALTRITYYLVGVSAILLHKDVMTGKVILDWRKKGIRVFAWTVNTPAEKQYFARVLKVTYLTDTLTAEGTTHTIPL